MHDELPSKTTGGGVNNYCRSRRCKGGLLQFDINCGRFIKKTVTEKQCKYGWDKMPTNKTKHESKNS